MSKHQPPRMTYKLWLRSGGQVGRPGLQVMRFHVACAIRSGVLKEALPES
jgi:hypothetical protein